MGNNGRNLVALLSGAFVGAGSALLLAPQSGEKTRNKLRNLSKQAKGSVGKSRRNLVNRIKHLRQDVERFSTETLENGQERVNDELQALISALDEGQRVLRKERTQRRKAREDRKKKVGAARREHNK